MGGHTRFRISSDLPRRWRHPRFDSATSLRQKIERGGRRQGGREAGRRLPLYCFTQNIHCEVARAAAEREL